MKTVVVGMSGGVDSAVAALLLKQQGYRVIGLFMKNWEEADGQGTCLASKDFEDVIAVCNLLEIPYYSVNFAKEYWELVFSKFLAELKLGHTPNPDILCNREIKFNLFFKKALELGADLLATGHYCQTNEKGELLRGSDPSKDQSYFLSAVKSSVLKQVLFPVGGYLKSEVRKIARQHQLPVSEKKDSTGICFIGERNFRHFLGQYLPYTEGNFTTLKGEVVGKHVGAAYYTIGQRKGLGLGGEGKPWFVVGKDVERNLVFVERGDDHPALYAEALIADEMSWVGGTPPSPLPYRCTAKIRYRQEDQECTIERIEGDRIEVRFALPQRAITSRQAVVFYQGGRCLGGAMILHS